MISYEKPKSKRFQDLSGNKYKNWTVIKFAFIRNSMTYFECKCCCGTIKNINAGHLKESQLKDSCGCIREANSKKHGWLHPAYKVWGGMIQRCTNPNSQSYPLYGGKNIVVCDEWKNNPDKFIDWAISKGYRKGMTIERIDVKGNYEPNNCKWIPGSRQPWNTSKSVLNPIKIRIALRLINDYKLSRKETGNILGGIKKSTIQKSTTRQWRELHNKSISQIIEEKIVEWP